MSPHFRILLCLFIVMTTANRADETYPECVRVDPALRRQAFAESAVPVREGVPVWNRNAVQFQFAPSFDFEPVEGARQYLYTLEWADGGKTTFNASSPRASLSPVWASLPLGPVELTIRAIDASGGDLGEVGRRGFHRASPFPETYPKALMTWAESADLALDALVHSPDLHCWFTTGIPDETFHLYRYPSKIIGASASALALHASRDPAPKDAAEALVAARRAGDYLLSLVFKEGSAWAFHPPTYHPTLFSERMKGHMSPKNYMTNCGAESGCYLLDLYAATDEPKYLEAAVRIAETYAERQLEEGSWLLFVDPISGEAVTENVLIPTLVIQFLDRLSEVTGSGEFDAMKERAVAWMMRNPVATWNWQGQFEDVKPLPPYENLTKHEAGDFAIHLLETAPQDPDKRRLALDLIRYAEDQFVMWASPPAKSPGQQNDDGNKASRTGRWMLPCVLEQYRCWAPVSASSAKLIRMYLAAHRATGDALPLEKAKALAATLTRAQSDNRAPGRYQTWIMKNPATRWLNCELMTVRAMKELAAADLGRP